MTYSQTIDYLYSSRPVFHQVGAAAYKPGPENILALMSHAGNPHRQFRSVHVAGTNGKGSTSHLIAAALQCAGLRVGLYTSPHLVDFRERMRINGVAIAEEEVVHWVGANKALLERLQPSFFETATALAFSWFAKEKVDIAIVETGLGGRLDATNIIVPELAVITNIGLDHTELLGTTLPAIAREKAGIMKQGVPCVIGETDAQTAPVFLERAAACGILGDGLETTDCRLWFADQCGYLRRCRQREVPECQLQGDYQEKNMQTAYVALRALGVSSRAIAEGFAHVCDLTGLRGRWETLCERPLTICDTGHNAHGLRYVAEQLRRLHDNKGRCLHIVFGMVRDKDVRASLALMPADAQDVRYYFTQAQTPRALPAEEMKRLWYETHRQAVDRDYVTTWATVDEAFRAAQKSAAPDDVVFIGGSNYVVGEVIKESAFSSRFQ